MLEACYHQVTVMESNRIHVLQPWNPECCIVIDNDECSTGLYTSLLTQDVHLFQPDTVKHTYWLGIYQSRSIQDPEKITIRNGSGVLHPVWLTILTTECMLLS